MTEGIIIAIITGIIGLIISIVSSVLTRIFQNKNNVKLNTMQKNIENIKGDTQKVIASLKGKIEKSNYVSKIVFDNIFNTFQNISKSMFDNYNHSMGKLFPFIDEELCFISDKEKKLEFLNNAKEKSKNLINEFVNLIHVNHFIIPENIFELLIKFENETKELHQWFKTKIDDEINEYPEKNISYNENSRLITLATHTSILYNEVQSEFYSYINKLSIVE